MPLLESSLEFVALSRPLPRSLFGGKAENLSIALRAGIPVPPGFGVSTSAVDALLAQETAPCAALADALSSVRAPFVVRSSAIDEDGEPGSSFAGIHRSVLDVSADDVIDAIREVHASGRTPSAIAYRVQRGLGPVRMAVLVQALVPAKCSGVAFSRDPVTGERHFLIEATWGLGETIVSGRIHPDRIRVDGEGRTVEAIIGQKDSMLVAGSGMIATPKDARTRLSVSDSEIHEVVDLCRRCEALFSHPVDVEWCIDPLGMLQLLQCRRIPQGRSS
jgi:pyruvate,water dikinase